MRASRPSGLAAVVLLLPLVLGPVAAGEGGASWSNKKAGTLGMVLGLHQPAGSPVFNSHYILGATIRIFRGYDLAHYRPGLRVELETGLDLMAARWGWGTSLSTPLLIHGVYEVLRSKGGRLRVGLYGGVGIYFHSFQSGITGVEVLRQVRPGLSGGLTGAVVLSRKWELTFRLGYARSFTSKLEAEFAGMAMTSRDRFGYGMVPVMVGVARRF